MKCDMGRRVSVDEDVVEDRCQQVSKNNMSVAASPASPESRLAGVGPGPALSPRKDRSTGSMLTDTAVIFENSSSLMFF